jgi:septum formation protein
MNGPCLILASRSPRRHQLLAEHHIDHRAVSPGVDDARLMPGQATPRQWSAALAYFKAAAAARDPHNRGVVLGADTVCVQHNHIIGQPADAVDARRILRAFDNAEHVVITGVALIDTDTGRRDIFADTASVRWGDVGDLRIDRYIDTGLWRGKAGAYNLHERLDAGWPITFTGDPTTIVGLPMELLTVRLEDFLDGVTTS